MTEKMIISPSTLDGTLPSTPSRWHTQFSLALASMALGQSRLERCAVDEVTIALIKGLEAMGARIDVQRDAFLVDGGLFHPRGEIDAGHNMENLALLAGIAANLPRNSRIQFQSRPGDVYPFLNALMAFGVSVSSHSKGGEAPWLIRGPSCNNNTHIPGDLPPAYICSLTLAGILRMRGYDITVLPPDHSVAMMDFAIATLSGFGIGASVGQGHIRVSGGEPLRPANIRIADDPELIVYPLVAGALCGRVSVNCALADSPIVNVLSAFNVDVECTGDRTTVKEGELNGAIIDLTHCPRAFPAFAVLAARAKGGSVLRSATIPGRDLINPTVRLLRRMGCPARATDDGAVIPHSELRGTDLEHAEDPLVSMASMIAACSATGNSKVSDYHNFETEYPGFVRHMKTVGLHIREGE